MIRIRRVQSTQLVLICAFAWCTFALGFLAAVRQEEKKLSIQASPLAPLPLRSGKHETPPQAGVPARLGFKPMTITAHADQGAEVQAEPVDEVEKASTASFRKVLQSPFEDVLSQVPLFLSLFSPRAARLSLVAGYCSSKYYCCKCLASKCLGLEQWQSGPPDPNFIREEVSVQVFGSEEVRTKIVFTKNPLPWILKKTVRILKTGIAVLFVQPSPARIFKPEHSST